LRSESRKSKLLFLMLAAAGGAVLYRWDPATSGLYPLCPFFLLTGWYCPGCGSLRALHQLLHGNWGAAFVLNPLLVLALPFAAYQVLALLLPQLRLRPLSFELAPTAWVRVLGVTLVAFGILRNVAP